MQANDDNENEDGAVQGLVDLGEANPYQGAIIWRNTDEMEGGWNTKFVTKTCSDYAR